MTLENRLGANLVFVHPMTNKKLLVAPGLTTRSKDATRAPGIVTSNEKLLKLSPCTLFLSFSHEFA